MVSLGEKLESFYLALLTIQSKNNDPNLIRLADVLYELETHNINENDGETNELLQDILKDARKKSSQILRIPYIESINQLITSSRKRLKAKTALDNETSIQHGQRYVHIFLELLGNWSNIIINLMNYGFSKEIIQLILQPLHIRIIEMAKECFLIMKQDKDLDSWCIKLMQSSFSSSSSNDDKDEGSNNNDFLINLTTLDNFTIQLSTMRNIINQHYLFLFHTFLPLFQPPDNDENNNNDHPNDNNNNNNLDHYSFLDHLLIVNKDELLQWKEIDMIYITLEIAYLQQSIIKACLEGVYYISLEDNIYILQLFEDSIFLFHKIIERCKQTNEEKVLFMISQKILEMLQFTLPSSSSSSLSHDDGMMSSPTSSSSSTVNTALFAQIIHNKRLFYYAYLEKKVVYQRTIKKILSTYTGRDFLRDDQETVPDIKRPLTTQPPTSKDGKGSDGYQTPLKPNAASSSNLALSAVTSLVESNSSLKQAASFFFSGVTGGDEDRDSDVTTATSSSKPSDDNRAQFPIWNEVMNNAAMSGVNQWIGWASPLLSDPTTTTDTNTNNNMKSPPRSSNGVEKSPSKKMPSTMEELLLHALDLTDDSGGKTGGVENDDSNNDYETSTYYYDHSYQPFFSKLIENDFIIYLNCLSVIIKALISLRVYLIDNGLSVLSVDQIVRQGSSTSSNGASTGSGGSSNSQSNSSIWVLIKEYWKCEQQYEEYLLQEMKQYIKQKYYIFERKQYEQLTSLQSDHSATSLLSLDVTPSNVAGNHPKVYLFKSYLERSYDITGQMMEERIQEQYIKHYYLLFLQQFPFSLSYFQLPEDKSLLSSSSSMLGSYGQSLAEKLPSFLVNPLTNFFFQSENEETSTSSSAITSGTGEGKQSVASSVESNNRSLLSESHYVMVLSEVVLFLLQQIVHRIIWGGDDNNHSTGNRRSTPLPQINEWGALLLQDDINSLRRYYDQCVFRYLPTSYDENEFNHKDEGEQEGVDSKNSTTNNDREYYSMNDRHVYYINQVKKYFLKISKIMILLTLDSPQDALRYKNMILLSSSVDQNSSLKVKGGTSRPVSEEYFKRKEDEFHEEEVRYLLTRRKDFSKDMIQRIKFNN